MCKLVIANHLETFLQLVLSTLLNLCDVCYFVVATVLCFLSYAVQYRIYLLKSKMAYLMLQHENQFIFAKKKNHH